MKRSHARVFTMRRILGGHQIIQLHNELEEQFIVFHLSG